MKSAPKLPAIPQFRRVSDARAEGDIAAQLCLTLAQKKDPTFSARAYAFIVEFVRTQPEPVSGETVTLACRQAGITPHDDRAFGSIYAKAIRNNAIVVVGFCARARGHGTAGGRLYAAGVGQ